MELQFPSEEVFLGIFGPGFVDGYAALGILSSGQLGIVALGAVSLLLVMTGHELDAAIAAGAAALLNAALNTALIPPFGIEGAAAATALSTFALTVGLLLRVRQRLGLRPSVLGAAA